MLSSGVSQSWNNQVNAYYLFGTIVKSMKEVVEETKTAKPSAGVKTKAQTELTEYTSSRQLN